MKQGGTLLGLALVFVLLMGVFILQERALREDARRPQPTPTPILQRVFPDLAVIDIDAIRLLDPTNDNSFTIARGSNDEWVAVGMEGVLDQEAATLIARTMVLLPYRESFAIDDDTDLTQFGFRPTGDFILLVITSAGVEHSVAIGDPTMNSPNFYGAVDDRNEIYLIERPAIDFLVDHFLNPPVAP